MKLMLISSLAVVSAAVIVQTARAESPVPCKPGYVRTQQPWGPCRLDVLATNAFKARTKAAPHRQRR